MYVGYILTSCSPRAKRAAALSGSLQHFGKGEWGSAASLRRVRGTTQNCSCSRSKMELVSQAQAAVIRPPVLTPTTNSSGENVVSDAANSGSGHGHDAACDPRGMARGRNRAAGAAKRAVGRVGAPDCQGGGAAVSLSLLGVRQGRGVFRFFGGLALTRSGRSSRGGCRCGCGCG